MVSVAASLAHVKSSVSIGILYIILSIVCAFVAHGLGSDFAQYISSRISDSAVISNKPYMKRAHTLLEHCGLSLVIYITISYIYLGEENNLLVLYNTYLWYGCRLCSVEDNLIADRSLVGASDDDVVRIGVDCGVLL